MHRSFGKRGRLAILFLSFAVLTVLLGGIGGNVLAIRAPIAQPPPPVSSGPPPSSSEFTLTETLTGPQNQTENPQFQVPPGGTVWDLVNSTCTVSAQAGLTPNTYAYIYSEAQRTLPDLYNPNLDNICLTVGDDSTNGVSATGYGGYGTSPPVPGAEWIQFDQIIQDTNVTGFAYAAQLATGETATFTLTIQPEVESAPASALYQFYPSTPTSGSEQSIKIPGSTPPAGEEYRVDNCALGFTIGTQSGQPVASMVIEPSGFVLCSMSNVTPEALSLTALATGGYSTSQTGPDSGQGQDGTQTVWSSVEYVTSGEWIDANFDAPISDGGQYMVLLVQYPSTPTYDVTLDESGLLSGTQWSVTFDGNTQSSTTTHLEFEDVKNGTYAYAVGAVPGEVAQPASGSVKVDGADANSAITFTTVSPPLSDVTFDESGLVSGTSWSVDLNGSTMSSTKTSIKFSETNGTYAYTIGTVAGFRSSPSSGSVKINGSAEGVAVDFTSAEMTTYLLTFDETGLSSGTAWSVTLNRSTASASTPDITFTETNGSYAYSIGAPPNFTASPVSGTAVVVGSNHAIDVTFVSVALEMEAKTSRGSPVSNLLALVGLNETLSSDSISVGPTNASGGAVWYGLKPDTTLTSVTIEGTLYRLSAYSIQTDGAKLIELNVTVVASGGAGSPTSYPIQFLQSGLGPAVAWWVNVSGPELANIPASGSSLSLNLPNGSYQYVAGAVEEYVPVNSTREFSVVGAGITIVVAFNHLTSNSSTPPTLDNLFPPFSPPTLSWYVIGVVGAVAIWLIGMVNFFVGRLAAEAPRLGRAAPRN
jgi:hypothetical protein